ncbi:MAG: LysR family transcriptional regulator [Lachnospiraceae bacterium]|nr:LysR family transcriptional regulator [Lachnospiraceae bacterium]
MNYLSLQYFLVVCQEMNITRAAKKLYISQQSLSEHINKLEKEYHVTLFQRSPKFRLTYAGEQMKLLAEQAVSLNNQIDTEMADIAAQKRGALSIGIRPTYSQILLPAILPVFHQQYPYIRLNLSILQSSEILPRLLNGQLDLAISSGRGITNSRLEVTPLLEDYHCMVIPENILQEYFHMTGTEFDQGAPLDYSQLENIPLLLTEPGKATRTTADRFLASHGIMHPNILIETNDFETNFLTCASGMGITVSFYMYYVHFIRTSRNTQPLYMLPINPPNGAPNTVFLRNKDFYFGNAAREFMRISREVVSNL